MPCERSPFATNLHCVGGTEETAVPAGVLFVIRDLGGSVLKKFENNQKLDVLTLALAFVQALANSLVVPSVCIHLVFECTFYPKMQAIVFFILVPVTDKDLETLVQASGDNYCFLCVDAIVESWKCPVCNSDDVCQRCRTPDTCEGQGGCFACLSPRQISKVARDDWMAQRRLWLLPVWKHTLAISNEDQ